MNTDIIFRFLISVPAIVFSCVLTIGCGKKQTEYQITETRVLPAGQFAIRNDLTSGERFGNNIGAVKPRTELAQSGSIPLKWDLPEGWKEGKPTSMRMVNLSVAGRDDSECYVTILSGRGGGVNANINRWRKQMSLAPLTSQDIEQLPKKQLFGHDATYLECTGDFTGMGAVSEKKNYKLSGLILEHRGIAMFVKMTGPSEIVDSEIERFDMFCRSLKLDQAPKVRAAAGIDHPSHFEPEKLHWHAPDHWRKGDERQMRLVTYLTGSDSGIECYITVLPGTAGGAVSNINRWRRQVGLEAVTEEVVADLPTLNVYGVQVALAEVSGNYTGMSGEKGANYTILGVVCPLPGFTLFIKMVGPHGEVRQERDQFIKFCQSIHDVH